MSDQPGPWPIPFHLLAWRMMNRLDDKRRPIEIMGACTHCGVTLDNNDDVWCAQCLKAWRAIGGYSEQVDE